MKKILISVIVVFGLGLVGGSVYVYSQSNTEEQAQESSQQQPEQTAPQITISEDGKTVSYDGAEGTTALVTLEGLTEVKTKDSSFGKFVTAINGVEADSKTEYWAFYVNGTPASVGAETYTAKANDKFEWRLEKLTVNGQ